MSAGNEMPSENARALEDTQRTESEGRRRDSEESGVSTASSIMDTSECRTARSISSCNTAITIRSPTSLLNTHIGQSPSSHTANPISDNSMASPMHGGCTDTSAGGGSDASRSHMSTTIPHSDADRHSTVRCRSPHDRLPDSTCSSEEDLRTAVSGGVTSTNQTTESRSKNSGERKKVGALGTGQGRSRKTAARSEWDIDKTPSVKLTVLRSGKLIGRMATASRASTLRSASNLTNCDASGQRINTVAAAVTAPPTMAALCTARNVSSHSKSPVMHTALPNSMSPVHRPPSVAAYRSNSPPDGIFARNEEISMRDEALLPRAKSSTYCVLPNAAAGIAAELSQVGTAGAADNGKFIHAKLVSFDGKPLTFPAGTHSLMLHIDNGRGGKLAMATRLVVSDAPLATNDGQAKLHATLRL